MCNNYKNAIILFHQFTLTNGLKETGYSRYSSIFFDPFSKSDINLNISDKQGNTPLIISSGKGFYNTSKYLIKNKVDINAKNNNGNTALIFAAQSGKFKIVKLLLNSKADPSIRNKNRKTALDIARSNGFKKTEKLISASDKSSNFLNIF